MKLLGDKSLREVILRVEGSVNNHSFRFCDGLGDAPRAVVPGSNIVNDVNLVLTRFHTFFLMG